MAIKLSNRQVQRFLQDIIGQNGVLVLQACEKPCTDERIMKRTKLKLPTIRSTLNQLHYAGLIAYDRKKSVDTNWYTYTWYAKKEKIAEIVKQRWEGRLEELQNKLNYESNYVFFKCEKECEKLPFELAAEYDFTCPDCGMPLQNVDNKKAVRSVVQEIKELQELMGRVG